MDPLPNGWPPQPAPPTVVPLFPLPNVWLFPNVVLPLRIFERRYRQMIEDSLDGPGRIVMGTVMHGHENEILGSPPVHAVGGLGEIGHHERLSDGRFNILLLGLGRVRLREVESDRLYRKVQVEPLDETPPTDEDLNPLREEVSAAVRARTQDMAELPHHVPLSQLVDFLSLRMPLPPDVMQRLYNETDVSRRARMALEEHSIRPIPKPEERDPPPPEWTE